MLLYALVYALGTFAMYDFSPELNRNDIQQWEIECDGETHIVEHWTKPDPEMSCKVIEMIIESGNDMAPILDDKKKYKP